MTSDLVRQAVYAPLNVRGRVEVVLRRLTDAIALGMLPDGERLPSEAELAETLGVSPMSVREALSSLRERGLVETRRGRNGGSFVRGAGMDPEGRRASRLSRLSQDELREFGDYYACISGTIGRLAAERSLPDDLRPLAEVVDEMAGVRDTASHSRLEARFHLELARFSQSVRLTYEEISLQGDLGMLLWAGGASTDKFKRIAHVHREIYEAILQGDGDAARTLCAEHVLAAVAALEGERKGRKAVTG